MFPSRARGLLQEALEALADSDNYVPAQALTLRHDGPLVNGPQVGISRYLDGRLVLKQYQTGHAPACLPTGEFRIRHFGADLDCEALEAFFKTSAVELLCVEVIWIQGQADFAYKVRR